MVINRTTRLRWRRRFRRSRQQVEDVSSQAEEHLERHFIRRLARLQGVQRFLISWMLLILILIGGVVGQIRHLSSFYLSPQPVPGGTFVVGILGSFTNANPLYATSGIDSSAARLVFASLFKYNQNHQLVGDLAESMSVDERGTAYTVHLRKNLTWQDGFPLTAADVVFTYQSIQNPDAKSPLASSWQGISVTAVDPQTIQFVLPNSLSAFPYSMTNGIVPKHLLSGILASQLRSVSFNTSNPIGAGPFKWDAVEVTGNNKETRGQQIALLPNEHYHGGKPKLSKFVIRSFFDDKQMIDSFNKRELNAMSGLEKTPSSLNKDLNIYEYNIPLLSEVMIFLKNSNDILKDPKVRAALTAATDTAKIDNSLGYPVLPARGPLLLSQLGYDKTVTQLSYDPVGAQKLLEDAGWKLAANGIRQKDGKGLTFALSSQNNPEFNRVVGLIKNQWKAVGVDVRLLPQSEADLQTTISFHNYDSLIFGISVGVDPDVFAYWHSSQADVRSQNRLNLSEYKSATADKALEAGRTRSDPSIRAIKYRPFLDAWRTDAPAIALYQPRFLYITRGQVFGFDPHSMNTGTDRYANVENWMIHEDQLPIVKKP